MSPDYIAGLRTGVAICQSQPAASGAILAREIEAMARSYNPATSKGVNEFPKWIYPDGVPYYLTGKIGIQIATGKAACEYESKESDAVRVWMNVDGTTYLD